MRRIKLNPDDTLDEDPHRLQVTMQWGDRILLGEVHGYTTKADRVGELRTSLIVRHFNGELWPMEPLASSVEVLERTYEEPPE